jgi:hypothetical protein
MKRALHTVSRVLVAAMALSLVLTICPCPPGAEGAMDDCCEPLELSISNPCCDEAPSVSPAPVSPAIVSLEPPLAVRALPFEFRAAVVPAERVFSRSGATRTILRI